MSNPQFVDRVLEVSSTTGSGPYELEGAITGYQTFAAVGDGNSCFYCAIDVDESGVPSGDWEVGLGTYTASGTTLSRDSIQASSNAGDPVDWPSGSRRIFLTIPAAYLAEPNFATQITTPIVFGGAASADNLTLQSSSNATKGKLLFGTSAYDEANNRLGLGTASPGQRLAVAGGSGSNEISITTGGVQPGDKATIYGRNASGANLWDLLGDASNGLFELKVNGTTRLSINYLTGTLIAHQPVRLKGYTVATLPAGTLGDMSFVTDALSPVYGSTVAGGGSVVKVVFYNGSNWIVN
jgi:hypothetical protein